ncbi:hypothetical protein T4D_4598 [Trichinella pseudospiralis]|uniref:Uncharacterized protein n=1 Tax=Trichinella pseudospiralis TaxID=6337 RepID=A0A0V1DRD6_TRIPS|nr:hypothetical protein T4D_4598 [Trichinella pseudospiralis]
MLYVKTEKQPMCCISQLTESAIIIKPIIQQPSRFPLLTTRYARLAYQVNARSGNVNAALRC